MSVLTRDEQQTIVHDLCQGLEREIIQAIKQSRIPAEWTGYQLRHYIADRAKDQIAYLKLPPGMAKTYKNDILVNNL